MPTQAHPSSERINELPPELLDQVAAGSRAVEVGEAIAAFILSHMLT